ncbi:TonB-dependent receptor [bacterium]|nr:TonB-dependent receptor [bacterium]
MSAQTQYSVGLTRSRIFKMIMILVGSLLQIFSVYSQDKQQSRIDVLKKMTLEELMNVEVVSASDKPEGLSEAPANITVISGEELRHRGYTTLMDLLSDLPGVTWIGRYSAFTTQVIRGNFNSKRLMLLFNGIPFNPKNGFGTSWADRFPIEGIKNVEFIIGPYGSLYGRNTYSGVLNVITKKGEDVNGGEITALYGKDHQMQGTAIFGKKVGALDIYLSFYKNYSDRGINLVKEYPNYYAKDKREQGSLFGNPVVVPDSVSADVVLPWDNREIFLKIAHSAGLELQLQYNHADMPKVGAGFTALYYVPSKECMLTDKTLNASLSYRHNLNNKISISSNLIYQNFDWLAKNLYLTGTHRWYAQQAASYMFNQKIRWRISTANELFASISFERVHEKALIASTSQKPVWAATDKTEIDYLNISLQDEISLTEKMKIVLGLMYENSSIYQDVLIPRFSGIYTFNKNNVLKLIYSSGFLTPDPEVRVIQDRIKGRTDIHPEYIYSFDVNYTRIWNKNISTIMSVFHNQTKNLIQQVADSTLPPPYEWTWENKGDARSFGVDFTLKARLAKNFSSFLSYSYVEGNINDLLNGNELFMLNRLPAQALHHFKLGLNFLFWSDKLNLYVHNLFVGDRPTWEDEEIKGFQFSTPGHKIAGYNVVDINVRTTDRLNSKCYVSFGVRNLFDVRGFDPSHSNYDVSTYSPIRRRSWTMRIEYIF